MRKFKIIPLLLLLLTMATSAAAQKKTQKTYIPWDNGKLVVSEEGRYLKHENGAPFFWLGETGWLLPERLNRDEAEYYLEQCKRRGYNVIQVQTLNNVPSMNIYGQYSMIDGYNFKNINQTDITSKTSIKKVYTVIGTTWITSSVQQPRKVSISVWSVFGEAR